MDNNQIMQSDYLEIVFDGRNKAYGAYDLRRAYNHNVKVAIFITWGLVALLFLLPHLLRAFAPAVTDVPPITLPKPTDYNPKPDEAKSPIVDKAPAPPKEETKPILPEKPLPTVTFTPPVVISDKDITNKEPPRAEDLKQVQIGQTDQKGDTNGTANLLSASNGTGKQALAKSVLIEPEPEDNKVLHNIMVQQKAAFPGGETEMYKLFAENIKYPAFAKEANITGKVFLSFTVEKDGSITDAKVKRGIGGGCDEESVRVIKLMPHWSPAKQNGKAVRIQFNLPIFFSLD